MSWLKPIQSWWKWALPDQNQKAGNSENVRDLINWHSNSYSYRYKSLSNWEAYDVANVGKVVIAPSCTLSGQLALSEHFSPIICMEEGKQIKRIRAAFLVQFDWSSIAFWYCALHQWWCVWYWHRWAKIAFRYKIYCTRFCTRLQWHVSSNNVVNKGIIHSILPPNVIHQILHHIAMHHNFKPDKDSHSMHIF